jgi:hypothetical protein
MQKWLENFLDSSSRTVCTHTSARYWHRFVPRNLRSVCYWITALQDITDGRIIALDARTLRQSYGPASGQSAIQMVSARVSVNHVSLGQVVVDQMSDKITVIQKTAANAGTSGLAGDDPRHRLSGRDCSKDCGNKITYAMAVKGSQPAHCLVASPTTSLNMSKVTQSSRAALPTRPARRFTVAKSTASTSSATFQPTCRMRHSGRNCGPSACR